MRYEFFIGKRYLFSRRRDRSISLITWISIAGVALGVIALIVSTSVMNGFRDNLRRAIIGSFPHITIFGWQTGIHDHEELDTRIRENPKVKATAPYIYKQALLAGEKRPKGSLIRGIDPKREIFVTEFKHFLQEEIYPFEPLSEEEQKVVAERILQRLDYPQSQQDKKPPGIVLGATLANQLEVHIGDTVKLISSEERMTPIGDVPKIKQLEVIGIFQSGISGYDDVLAFVDFRLVQKLYNLDDRVSGIGIRIEDPENAQAIADDLKPLALDYQVSNWAEENKSIFQVMKLEKIGLFVILTLIVVVAAFNIIASLIMLVIEKSKEIAILKSLGATDQGILRIFLFQGVVIGSAGTFVGLALGLLICWVLMTFNIVEIPPGVYPGGDRIPVAINWVDVGLTAFSSWSICFLVTLYPAWKASRMQPVESLRYE